MDEDRATHLANRLAEVLEAEGGWYCDFRTDDDEFVVFSGRVFRYQRGNLAACAHAAAYARKVGVPEAQIDWPELADDQSEPPWVSWKLCPAGVLANWLSGVWQPQCSKSTS
jgi:hypothetical protein